MRSLTELTRRGQSPWYDNLSRSLITSGELAGLIGQGIVGVTSNPTIFDKSISSSHDYDDMLRACKTQGKTAEETYWDLVCADIMDAADILRPTYDATQGRDGYVSVEVSPLLAHSTAETIAQANELYARLSRDNVMIKIPATSEGIDAISAVLANGIPVNVTLIFSQSRYLEVVNAYKKGTEQAHTQGASPQSVASFFISRLDTKVDALLPDDSPLRGKAAIANASAVYAMATELFVDLSQAQRPLWASTSTKNPEYSPTLYVDELIAAETVNTLPHATIDAIHNAQNDFPAEDLLAHQQAHADSWEAIVDSVSIDVVMKELEDEGVEAFGASYESCLSSISSRLADM